MKKLSEEFRGMIGWATVNAIVLHVVFSGVFVLGFIAGMGSFTGDDHADLAQGLLTLGTMFYYPVIELGKLGFPVRFDGVSPTFWSFGWCFTVGFLLVDVTRKVRSQTSYRVQICREPKRVRPLLGEW